jgi:GPH family glycoside/pentoside/hexuronide:cation symporter
MPTRHYATAPEDRISLIHKIIYGFGAFVNNLLAAAIGGMAVVLNIGLGMNPALVGLLGAIPRLTDAITDPLMGYISDNTRSRWGRRRPYIFIGAIFAGIVFALLWQFPSGMSEAYYFWYFLIGSFIFYLGYTIFATPWVALGYELTPDYHERTRLMGVQNFMGQFAYILSPWFLAIMQASMFTDMMQGASYLAVGIGLLTIAIGILPAIFLRERFAHTEAGQDKPPLTKALKENMLAFLRGFLTTIKVRPFLMLCTATFLVFNGFMLIASFSFYVITYYVFAGDTELGAEYSGWAGSVGAVSTFVVIAVVTWISTRYGKRHAFYFAMGMAIIGYALKWVCYNPDYPWLVIVPAPFMAFGLGGLFTLMGSMMADVCDLDELQTGERREGMFGSIYWWVVKLGMALALAASGFLLNATGFDVELKGEQTEQAIFLMRFFDVVLPIISTAIAIWAITAFSITEKRAQEIRTELEARRGALPVAD